MTHKVRGMARVEICGRSGSTCSMTMVSLRPRFGLVPPSIRSIPSTRMFVLPGEKAPASHNQQDNQRQQHARQAQQQRQAAFPGQACFFAGGSRRTGWYLPIRSWSGGGSGGHPPAGGLKGGGVATGGRLARGTGLS